MHAACGSAKFPGSFSKNGDFRNSVVLGEAPRNVFPVSFRYGHGAQQFPYPPNLFPSIRVHDGKAAQSSKQSESRRASGCPRRRPRDERAVRPVGVPVGPAARGEPTPHGRSILERTEPCGLGNGRSVVCLRPPRDRATHRTRERSLPSPLRPRMRCCGRSLTLPSDPPHPRRPADQRLPRRFTNHSRRG